MKVFCVVGLFVLACYLLIAYLRYRAMTHNLNQKDDE